jgi:hypothetical protein
LRGSNKGIERLAVNGLEVRIAALRRSGSHAVIQWLLRQLSGRGAFLDNCAPGESPYTSCYLPDSVGVGVDLAAERELGPRPKDFLLYNYEGKELAEVFSAAAEARHDEWVGTSARRVDLLVLRDPWNNLASLLRWARGDVHPIALAAVAAAAHRFREYAREHLGEARRLRHSPTFVSFNRWVAEHPYREALAERLGVPFTDGGIDEVAPWGPTAWGDSFDGLAYDGRARDMALGERFRWAAGDPFYRGLFDAELVELSERLFGPIPGTEALAAAARGAPRVSS